MNKLFYFSALLFLISSTTYAQTHYVGLVRLMTQSGGGINYFGVVAQFFPDTVGGTFCATGTLAGACCYWPPTKTIPTELSAGTLTLTNPSTHEAQILQWNPTTNSYSAPNSKLTWKQNDLLNVQAGGGTIPAFKVSTIAPTPIVAYTNQNSISVSSDWKFTWQPTNATSVDVGVTGTHGAFVCRAQDRQGQITIPKALIQLLGAAGEDVVIGITRANISTLKNQNVQVDVQAETNAGLMGKLAE